MSFEIIVSLIAALGLSGILIAVLNRRFEQQKQTNEHDINIFKKSNDILAEKELNDIVNFHLLEFHRINDNNLSSLKKWCVFFGFTGNKFLNKDIDKKNKELLDDLEQLVEFIKNNFDSLGGQNPNFEISYLKPELDPDRAVNEDDVTKEQVDKYQLYANELSLLTRNTKRHYSEYRLAVKNKLKI